jgi:iron complex transport system substrate-binding protein
MKKKIAILIGIAICAILLTSPVLASAGHSKIYGNANEDDTLDMRDVTYIKLAIFGKKPATDLADANYDGKISMLDIGQTKLIILGKEKELTLVDQAGRVVMVPRPIERVVAFTPEALRIMIALGEEEKLVGTDFHSPKYVFDTYPKVFPEGKELPTVGYGSDPNLELIVSLKPDAVFAHVDHLEGVKAIQNLGIPVVCVYSYKTWDKIFEEIGIIGTVSGKEKEAEELISYFTTKNTEVEEITSQIPDSEKPTVYLAFGSPITKRTPVVYDPVNLAGGLLVTRNILGTPGRGGTTRADVSKEQIIEWNPDIILIPHHWKTSEPTIENVLSDPDLQTINAIKNRRVHYTLSGLTFYMADQPRVFTEILIMAKLFHPDKFEDLDVEKEGNEIFERFYHVDGLWTELGTELGFIE